MSQNNIIQKTLHFLVLCNFALYCAWLLLPSFQIQTGAIIGLAFVGVCGIGIVLDFTFFRKHSKDILWLAASALFLTAQLCIVYTVGLQNFVVLFPQVFMIFFPFIVVYYLKKRLENREIIILLFLLFLLPIITSVINIYWLHNNAFTARALGYGEADENYLRRAMSYGIGGFGFNYGLLFYIAGLCYAIKLINNKALKMMLLVFILLASYTLFLSRYLIAFVLLLLSLFIFLSDTILSKIQTKSKKNISKQIFSLLLLLILVFFLFQQSILEFLQQFLTEKNYEDYAGKLQAIQSVFQYSNLENAELGRIDDYNKAISTIFQSPFIGIRADNHYEISGHSTILDIMADSGVPVALIFLAVFIFFIQKSSWPSKNSKKSYYQYTYFILFLLALLNKLIHVREAFLFLAIFPLLESLETQENNLTNVEK